LIKPLKASCPQWVCKKCGKPRVRIVKQERGELKKSLGANKEQGNVKKGGGSYSPVFKSDVVGWSDCGCGGGFDAGVVLDPFCGRGTVGKVAKQLGLHYILFDAKPEYCELARLYIAEQKYKLIKYQQKLEGIET
ncbi:unnamed protein product, partial [marine sediment metagenome]